MPKISDREPAREQPRRDRAPLDRERGREVTAAQEQMRARMGTRARVRAIRSGVAGPERVPAG